MTTITMGDPAVLNPALVTAAIYLSTASSTQLILTDPTTGLVETFSGAGLTYLAGQPTGGTITGLDISQNGHEGVTYAGLNFSILQFVNGSSDTVSTLLLGGDDQITGSAAADMINGGAGNDTIAGGAGNDTIIALDGNDTVDGGDGNDDVNGNKGEDIVYGGAGNDTVRGGQGNDTIFGGDGDDGHVNGNLGDDSVSGGNGNDTVYGGQGNDTLHGDAGNDLLSGDLGNDILWGDAGADRFAIARGGGFDWVADFHASEGDRIQLAPGTAYTVTSISGQVVIDLGGGDELGLAGIAAGTFSSSWIVFG